MTEAKMSLDPQQLVSAQVVLRAAPGRPIPETPALTAETLPGFLPSPEVVQTAVQAFRQAGFELGPLVGISFSITAPAARFEELFHARLRRKKDGSLVSYAGRGRDSFELPLEALPARLRDIIEAVAFTPPPDFGPTRFGP
jgi:hypothetical protein